MKTSTFIKQSFKKLFAFVLLTSVLSGAIPVAAQTAKKPTGGSPAAEKMAKSCPNCWSGVISYTKTLEDKQNSNEPAFGTGDPKNERTKHHLTRSYRYEGKVVVDSTGGRTVTHARVSFSDKEEKRGSLTQWVRCHSNESDHIKTYETRDERAETALVFEPAESFEINTYAGNAFHFAVEFPDAPGTFEKHSRITHKNFCPDAKPAPSDTDESSPTKISGETAVIDGALDPKNPDVIKGTKTWGGATESGIATFKYKVTWSLTRKPAPLMITDVKFYQPIYPSPNDWRYIDANDNAVDGNQVKVAVSILNLSGAEKTVTPQFKELKENIALAGDAPSVTIKPHEEEEVEMLWDTSGFAWKDSGGESQPETTREIEVKIPGDEMSKEIKIYPKPIVVVMGVWSKTDDVRKFKDYVKAVSDKWRFFAAPVDIHELAADAAQHIDEKVRQTQESENAWHVDLVAHSTGGLSSRVYVNGKMPTLFDGKPAATHLVMVATPNKGTPCVKGIDGIIARIFNKNADALGEITGANMKRFNSMVTNNNGTKFSALVGSSAPQTCQKDAPGDGLITTTSGIWTVTQNKTSTAARHMQMLGEVSHFQQIKKWLAVPPRGDHAPATSASTSNFSNENVAGLSEDDFGKSRNYGAMFHAVNYAENKNFDDDERDPNFATGVKLAAKQSTEIEIPVTGGSELSLIFYAPANVSATLIDDKGETVGKNLVETAEANEIFRTITVKKSFQSGKWKLKLESRDLAETEIAVTAFIDYNAKISPGN